MKLMTPKIKLLRAMFDVRPMNESGSIDFEKLDNLPEVIKLREDKRRLSIRSSPLLAVADLNLKNVKKDREAILDEFGKTISQKFDITLELASLGAEFHQSRSGKPKKQGYIELPKSPEKLSPPINLPIAPLPSFKPRVKLENPNKILSGHKATAETLSKSRFEPEKIDSFMVKKAAISSPVSREMDILLDQFKKDGPEKKIANLINTENKFKPFKFSARGGSTFGGKKLIFSLFLIPLLLFFIQKGVNIKNDTVENGKEAIANLEDAKLKLEDLDFLSAANSFALASRNFSKASQNLNLMGASFVSLFSNMPGLGKISSAKNLVKAGENIAQAGENLSAAFDILSQTNFVSYFGSYKKPAQPLSDFIKEFRNSFVFAKNKIDSSYKLLADINSSVLPEDKQQTFIDFKEKIPQFQKFINSAVDYSDFLLSIVGKSGNRKYLILFQNNSELRPTGGFPGTYGILDFEDGYFKNIFVDDIYNPDGQIRANIIPPKELQHITPTWGMRDAAWFADFPVSAKKVIDMYSLDNGPSVDGVFTVTPTIISRILEVIGPIEMPEYGVSLNASNFLAEVQEEVEYGDKRKINQSKKIIVDFAPRFIAKLASEDKGNWLKIFQILMDGLVEKHILAYFRNASLERIAVDNDFGGEVKNTDGDFLLVTHSNIKGSKTDAVIKNSIEIGVKLTNGGFIEHNLKIIRIHTGGKSSYGFYNRQNYDYIRVMVPAESELIETKGNSLVSSEPLINYDNAFSIDKDLERYELGMTEEKGIKVFQESGKTVFGFWLVLNPSETKAVAVKYLTPAKAENNEYSLLVQKQPGTIDDKLIFNFTLPSGKNLIFKHPPELQFVNNNLILDSDLLTDRAIGLKWR